MACLTDWKRETSPISRAQVSAVIGPTPGIVLNRSSRSPSSGSRSSELNQGIVQPLRSNDRLPAQLQQRSDTLVNLFVARHQFREVTQLVQPLLVVTHSGLHQQTRNAVLHLDHLLQHKVPVAQRPAPVPNLGGSH